ncbi:MAG: protein-L-isoaspartate(D-aspartate) O-methyltransferase [Candidatus Aminicenantes bacterium]|nr:protein-L-isoaspartate(D-aspartate) O-methyltransferase [Candidatus Aminicenantes bacterium]
MDYQKLREYMVNTQIKARGIYDPKVLDAMLKVPRHEFVPEDMRPYAYEDRPLPIGEGQTISQPYMVALMSQCLELEGSERILEIGAGSGYQAAILAEIAAMVYTIERFPSLLQRAQEVLARLGYTNYEALVGDGTLGWEENAPFNGIMVTAGAPDVPPSLLEQLADKGRLVIPIGPERYQTLYKIVKKGKKIRREFVTYCSFVPLIGKEGWGNP